MQTQMQLLLDKVAVIKLRQEAITPTDNFNIFRILRSASDEVNLHSRFIFELLNPKGSHGMGDVFLRIFAKQCKLPPLSYDTVSVLREHASIDILIQDNNQAIVIENKVYAGDQPKQLERYHSYVVNSYRQPTLIYLTLHGHKPSEQSSGNLEVDPFLISYKDEINQWLSSCIKEAAMKPLLRETIMQYQNLVNQLTGNTMNEEEKNQVLKLMSQGENAEFAAIITRNWDHVRWHTEYDFWTEMLALIKANFKVSDDLFTAEDIDRVVHERSGKNWYYGIAFSIGQLFDNELIFRIERGEREPIYYGLLYCSAGKEVNEKLRSTIQFLGLGSSKSWAGFRCTASGIDFSNFNKPITLQLASMSKRQQITVELWAEITAFISNCTVALSQSFGTDFLPINPVV